MKAESESGGKSRITDSEKRAWLWKNILIIWIFHKLYPLTTCPILFCLAIEMSIINNRKMIICTYILLLSIISIPGICQFGLYFFKCLLEVSLPPPETPRKYTLCFYLSFTHRTQHCVHEVYLPWKMVLMSYF